MTVAIIIWIAAAGYLTMLDWTTEPLVWWLATLRNLLWPFLLIYLIIVYVYVWSKYRE